MSMEQIEFRKNSIPVAPRTTEESIYPNIDDTFTTYSYIGRRLNIRTRQECGIKIAGGMASNMQGFAIYGDIAVRMANVDTSTTHYVYRLSIAGNNIGFSEIATFTLNGTGHSNALQFSPVLESGQVLPYLYVSDVNGKCYVLSFDSSYQATIVQTITISGVGQVLMGDDGFIWTSSPGTDSHRKFAKYRKVSVSEGDVTLTDSDKVDEWETMEVFPSATHTSQGWKVKFGKLWYQIGMSGDGQWRGIYIYDTATHALVTSLDFSEFSTLEYEDLDFFDNAMIIATYIGPAYLVRT